MTPDRSNPQMKPLLTCTRVADSRVAGNALPVAELGRQLGLEGPFSAGETATYRPDEAGNDLGLRHVVIRCFAGARHSVFEFRATFDKLQRRGELRVDFQVGQATDGCSKAAWAMDAGVREALLLPDQENHAILYRDTYLLASAASHQRGALDVRSFCFALEAAPGSPAASFAMCVRATTAGEGECWVKPGPDSNFFVAVSAGEVERMGQEARLERIEARAQRLETEVGRLAGAREREAAEAAEARRERAEAAAALREQAGRLAALEAEAARQGARLSGLEAAREAAAAQLQRLAEAQRLHADELRGCAARLAALGGAQEEAGAQLRRRRRALQAAAAAELERPAPTLAAAALAAALAAACLVAAARRAS
eukprot:tig00000405_g496.t1